jgi:lipid-binding SYLF domain-containing protein
MNTRTRLISLGATLGLALSVGAAHAGPYSDTVTVFKSAGRSATFFDHCYAYAVFPNIGEGGFVVAGAHGDGRVYVHGHYQGKTSMSQVSVGFLAGGKAFSQIIFFENKQALDLFESGHFQFSADASVIAITASASAQTGSTGSDSGASASSTDAVTSGLYHNGMVVFTVAKGGAMFDVSIGGQKFSYSPRGAGAAS